MERGLGDRGTTLRGKVAQGKRRMAKAQLGRLAQARGQRLEATVGDELAHGLSLAVRGTRRAHEIRMVGVCEAVRARSRCADNSAFLEE